MGVQIVLRHLLVVLRPVMMRERVAADQNVLAVPSSSMSKAIAGKSSAKKSAFQKCDSLGKKVVTNSRCFHGSTNTRASALAVQMLVVIPVAMTTVV